MKVLPKIRVLKHFLAVVTVRNFQHAASYTFANNIDESKLIDRIMSHLKIRIAPEVMGMYDKDEEKKKSLRIQKLLKSLPRKKFGEKLDRIKLVDLESAARVEEMMPGEIFAVLNSFINNFPERIADTKFYNLAIKNLVESIAGLNMEELILTIFYIGLGKKTSNSYKFLHKCMMRLDKKTVNELTIEDLCVICNSTFKTSTKITNKLILDQVVKTLNENLSLLKDPAFLVTFIKTLRHNRYQNDDILSTISCGILFNQTSELYSFVAICHILALYADYLYYDEALLGMFVEKCIEKLKEDDLDCEDENIIRIKDIKRFLWALSNLGYSLEADMIENVIEPNIMLRIKKGGYDKSPDVLLDTVLYMWVLNYQATDVLPYVLTPENIQTIKEMKNKSKARLNVLLSVMQFENPQLYRLMNSKTSGAYMFSEEVQIKNRPTLERTFKVLQKLVKKLEVNKFLYTCEVPYLNIVGITGFKKNIYKSVYIEVLDDYVCVKNKDRHPTGPMKMKLRILENLDEALIQIYEDEIEEMTDNELLEYLENEIRMLC